MNLLGFKMITCVSSFVPSVIPPRRVKSVPASLCILRKCWMPCLLESFILYISPSQSSRWQCWQSNMILGGVGGVRMELIQDDVKSRKWQKVGSLPPPWIIVIFVHINMHGFLHINYDKLCTRMFAHNLYQDSRFRGKTAHQKPFLWSIQHCLKATCWDWHVQT